MLIPVENAAGPAYSVFPGIRQCVRLLCTAPARVASCCGTKLATRYSSSGSFLRTESSTTPDFVRAIALIAREVAAYTAGAVQRGMGEHQEVSEVGRWASRVGAGFREHDPSTGDRRQPPITGLRGLPTSSLGYIATCQPLDLSWP